MTGAAAASMTPLKVLSEMCETSTSMPSRFITATISRPKSVRARIIGGGIARGAGPRRVLGMRERQVAAPQVIEPAELVDARVDHVAALDAEQDGDLAVFAGVLDFCGPRRPLPDRPGWRATSSLDRRDDLEGFVELLRRAAALADAIDREEDRRDAAVAHARDVDLAVVVAPAPDRNPRRGCASACRSAVSMM